MLLVIGTLLFFVYPNVVSAGPLNTTVIVVDEDTVIPIVIRPKTGNTVPGFDTTYITDYQYAQKYTLQMPDGSLHKIPRVDGPNGQQFIPYYQVNGSCWDSGYLTQCRPGEACGTQPRCIANVIQGNALQIGGRIQITNGRFLLPGEITPDGFALAPMEPTLDRKFTNGGTAYDASWVTYFPRDVTPSGFSLQTQTPYYSSMPGEGGSGPQPFCAGTCYATGTRSVIEVLGPLGPGTPFRVYITGVNSSGNLLQDIVDVADASSYVNNPTASNPIITANLESVQTFIIANGLTPSLGTGIGHSLGAICIAGLFNAGYIRHAILISVPYFVSSEALQNRPWGDLTVYSGKYDFISNGLTLSTNATRIQDGVTLKEGDTGQGAILPHLLYNYDNAFPELPHF